MVTTSWDSLIDAAHALSMAPNAGDICVYGPLAQSIRASRGVTAAADAHYLIVTVSDEVYEAWASRVRARIICAMDCAKLHTKVNDCRRGRFSIALDKLGVDEASVLEYWCRTQERYVPYNIQLMPSDWMNRIDRIRADLYFADPISVGRMAQEAIVFLHDQPHWMWQTETVLEVTRPVRRPRPDVPKIGPWPGF